MHSNRDDEAREKDWKSAISLLGKERIISELVTGGFILNLGCATTQYGGVGVDIRKEVHPSIVADACQLPLKSESFDQVVFSDVIEHLPKGAEGNALREIWRVLRPGGSLILSTPNDFLPFNTSDPGWYLGHRHYKAEHISSLLDRNGFEVVHVSSRGSVFSALDAAIFGNRVLLGFSPRWLKRMSDREYSIPTPNGYTLFVLGRKRTVALGQKNGGYEDPSQATKGGPEGGRTTGSENGLRELVQWSQKELSQEPVEKAHREVAERDLRQR